MPPCPRCGKETVQKEDKYRCADCGITFGYGEGSLNLGMTNDTGEVIDFPHAQEAYEWKFGQNS